MNYFIVGLQTAGQSFLLLWLVLIGLKLVGKRAFGELGPQDLVLIMLVAEAMDIGLTPDGSGLFGSIISGIVLMGTMYVVDRIPRVRTWLDGSPVVLYARGKIDVALMERENISLDELQKAAREYGCDTFAQIEKIVLEGDGSITCVFNERRYAH